MKLTNKQIRFLKAQAHSLNPIITIGNKGLTESVQSEIDSAIAHHELIKIKLPAGDKQDRLQLLNQICDESDSSIVQLIGRIGVTYRPATPQKLTLPQ